MPADQAASAVYAALSVVRHRQRRWCTKKSTPHFAAISARSDGGAPVSEKLAVIAAAIPAAGRTTL